MASEARVISSLQIRKGNFVYQSQPTSFTANITNVRAPTPGLVNVPTTGINVDLSLLNYPGLIWMQNQDITNYVEWGIHDGSIFHILGRMLPGEIVQFRLSPDIGEEESATGTGTTAPVNNLYLKAHSATCDVRVDAFDS